MSCRGSAVPCRNSSSCPANRRSRERNRNGASGGRSDLAREGNRLTGGDMSTVNTATKRMTADEFFDWHQRPENDGKHFELVRGEVVQVPRPGERHAQICANVGWVLSNYMR